MVFGIYIVLFILKTPTWVFYLSTYRQEKPQFNEPSS